MSSLQVVKKGPKLLDQPMRLVDVETHEVIWDRDKDTLEVRYSEQAGMMS